MLLIITHKNQIRSQGTNCIAILVFFPFMVSKGKIQDLNSSMDRKFFSHFNPNSDTKLCTPCRKLKWFWLFLRYQNILTYALQRISHCNFFEKKDSNTVSFLILILTVKLMGRRVRTAQHLNKWKCPIPIMWHKLLIIVWILCIKLHYLMYL